MLPVEYNDYLKDGPDAGETTGLPGYFQLWSAEEIDELNRSYGVAEYAPGFVGFGSDGGGEMLAFDSKGAVFMIPFVGISPKDAMKIADSWSAVVARMSRV